MAPNKGDAFGDSRQCRARSKDMFPEIISEFSHFISRPNHERYNVVILVNVSIIHYKHQSLTGSADFIFRENA